MSEYKIVLDDGKYEFVLNENGQLKDVLRHGEHWKVGFEEWRFSKAVMLMLWRIKELEENTK